MNGAKSLLLTLLNAGVDTCFTNPGTSEMHFVAALDESGMRAVLTLFEGVATGAADGYARMANKPAATLLHLGCGLGNGLANLHNARKAKVPIVNIIGDHATYHTQYDAQLQSDIETVARNVSTFVYTSKSTAELSRDAAEAFKTASGPPGQVATLILPADVSWGENGKPITEIIIEAPKPSSKDRTKSIAKLLKNGKKTAILLGGRVLLKDGLILSGKIAKLTGAKLFAEVFPTRMQRGEGLPPVERIAYLAEMATVQLKGYDQLILIDAKAPVSFFAYPGKKSYLVPDSCKVSELCALHEDALASLQALVEELGAGDTVPDLQSGFRPVLPEGKLTAEKSCQIIGALLPENVIISDEGQTSGVKLPINTSGAPPHDLLTLTGGAIGQGLPVAVGAAVACPDRKVLALQGDGSAMYTIQSLWTMKRENLDVVVIIFNNRSYAILNIELQRVGADKIGNKAKAQMDLSNPPIDFSSLAKGMGVEAVKVDTCEGFHDALKKAFSTKGPFLIDAIVPPQFEGFKLKALPHVLGLMEFLPTPLAKALKKKLAP
ncbi:MAG: acetolactate synthase large subunit [Leptospiraceae bacterium]|nr:acetolactate synthase large subunit [Leptospiraceae bacterium]MCP5511022.1 acetolactate synthase large subunit [Leptospiraceae bacterium]